MLLKKHLVEQAKRNHPNTTKGDALCRASTRGGWASNPLVMRVALNYISLLTATHALFEKSHEEQRRIHP